MGLKILRDTIKDWLNSYHSTLGALVQDNMDTFAAMVYDDPPNQETPPTYEVIMKQFKAKMDFKDLDDIRGYVQELFEGLVYLKHKEAAIWIRNDLIQRLNETLYGFVFNLKSYS